MKKITKLTAVSTVALGLALLPLASSFAADATANTVVNGHIGSSITISTSNTVDIYVTPTGSEARISSAADTVTVNTNNATGYNLTLETQGADTNLVKGSDTIAATAGTLAAPTALDDNSWGYRVDGAGGFGAGPSSALNNVASTVLTFAGVPANGSAHTIKTTSTTATNDQTSVWYGMKADSTKPNGVYTNTVVYTATTN